MLSRLLHITFLAAILVLLSLFYAQKINIVTADIGRHITNGQIFLVEFKIISTNFYSYTQPGLPVVNHHWGTGVLYYVVHQLLGFTGLSVLNVLLYLVTFLLFFSVAVDMGGFKLAAFTAVLSIPLITSRLEIRPEVISYLLLGLYFLLLYRVRLKRIAFKWLCILSFIQLLWVNMHIFFVMGIFLAGVFFLDHLVNNGFRAGWKKWLALLTSMALACLFNPFGLKGLLEPFMILREYGYMIVENQSIPFMMDRVFNPMHYHYTALLLIAAALVIVLLIRKKFTANITGFILLIVFGYLGFSMIRNVPLFGLFLIPVSAGFIRQLIDTLNFKTQAIFSNTMLALSFGVLLFSFVSKENYYTYNRNNLGLGVMPGSMASAGFFKKLDIKGRIYNNYDIGGYLIYHLYPHKKVFVDNRPEAYTVEFIKRIYGPMQHNETVWRQVSRQYDVQAIYFYRHDQTEHGQPFLIRRIHDREWAPVYVDDFTLILLRRNQNNLKWIEQLELPREMFVARPN